jgi:P4 family phage/plasmid primase-like protien
MIASLKLPRDVVAYLVDKAKEQAAEDWYKANHAQLVEVHGAPSRRNPARNYELAGLNEGYWAGAWALENLAFYDAVDCAFYRYQSWTGLWVKITEAALKQKISTLILRIARKYDHAADLENYRGDGNLSAVVRQLRGLIERKNPFAIRPKIVHLANCVIVIQNGKRQLRSFSPNFLSRNQSPISYNPNATCPRFLKELVEPSLHPEDIGLLQRYMGQCLLGRNGTARILLIIGEGGKGKSQIIEVIRGITGEENVHQLRTKHLSERFETYRYLGKSLLVGVDVKPNFLNTEGASELKGLTGGDRLSPEKKNGNGVYELKGSFNVAIGANNRLKVNLQGDEQAWRRRLLIMEANGPKPKNKVDDFGAKLLMEEGPGILNWALEGLEKIVAETAVDNDFVLTPRQAQVINNLLDESQSLRTFVQQCLRPAAHCSLTTAEITLAYVRYCRARGWDKGLKSGEIISKELSDLMVEVHGITSSHDLGANRTNRGYRNVEIVSDASDACLTVLKPTTSSSSTLPPELKPSGASVPNATVIPVPEDDLPF